MAKITVIGVTHSEEVDLQGNRIILNKASFETFLKKYSTEIDRPTLIVSEGFMDRGGFIGKMDSSYLGKLNRLSPHFLFYSKYPYLLFPDVRYSLPPKELLKYQHNMQMLEAFARNNIKEIDFRKPKTMDEAIQMIVSDNCNLKLQKEPDALLKTAARQFSNVERVTDNAFVESVMKYDGSFSRIFLIVGSTHALSIAKEKKWELDIVDIQRGFQSMVETVLSYIVLREIPKAIAAYQ